MKVVRSEKELAALSKKKTADEAKLIAKRQELWEFCLSKKWYLRPGPVNCLHFTDTKGRLSRLDFSDSKELVMLHKHELTDVEKEELKTRKTHKWVELQRGSYSKVKVAAGGLEFPGEKKKNKTGDQQKGE